MLPDSKNKKFNRIHLVQDITVKHQEIKEAIILGLKEVTI
jgi:hypothetical protein